MLHVILACLVVALVAAEVTILKEVTTIYDRTAKLRIKGAGFDVDASELIIGIGTMGQDNLVQGVDF